MSLTHRVLVLLALCAATLGAACAAQPSAPAAPQLRIHNSGSEDIHDLTLLFPGKTARARDVVRVAFGDIAAGATSAYLPVPGGIYRYAAYEYRRDGAAMSQSVVDWIGEQPLAGSQFTYRLRLDPQAVPGAQITLVDVVTEQP